MDSPANQRWLPMAMFFAIVYPVVGIVFAFAAFRGMAVFWRLAAWLVCAAAFAAHLWYEHARLQSPPRGAALHVSLAVALTAGRLQGPKGLQGRQGQTRTVWRREPFLSFLSFWSFMSLFSPTASARPGSR